MIRMGHRCMAEEEAAEMGSNKLVMCHPATTQYNSIQGVTHRHFSTPTTMLQTTILNNFYFGTNPEIAKKESAVPYRFGHVA